MVLGGTVAELQYRMSAAEFVRWCKYFGKYGRLGPVRMFDFGAALLACKIDHVMGGHSVVKDYLVHSKEPEEDEAVATIEEIIQEFGGVKRGV